MKKNYNWIVMLFLAFIISSCVNSGSGSGPDSSLEPAGQVMYNKYNIHVHYKNSRDIKAHCANWTGPFNGHMFVPPNTPMVVESNRRGLVLKRTDNGETIHYQCTQKFLNMDMDEYINTLFSPSKVSLRGLTAKDRKGVELGKALVGMTKKGVLTALGYPAGHKTASLDSREWIYWTNRFGTYAVQFDGNGRVKSIRD